MEDDDAHGHNKIQVRETGKNKKIPTSERKFVRKSRRSKSPRKFKKPILEKSQSNLQTERIQDNFLPKIVKNTQMLQK